MNRTLIIAALMTLVASAGLHANEAVTAPNLKVKERLQAIEQINVTAEKQAEPISDEQIAEIIAEAEAKETTHPRKNQ